MVVLSILWIGLAPVAVALPPVSPAEKGPSLDETMKYINGNLYVSNNPNPKCSDTAQVSVSGNHKEILVKYLVVDGKGRIKDNVEPTYVYHVPVAAVGKIYPSGPWTVHDRVVVRTNGQVVRKYGPVWDCGKSRLNATPEVTMRGSVELRVMDVDRGHLGDVVEAVKHLAKLLQWEQTRKPAVQF